jgi:hypothetical protein
MVPILERVITRSKLRNNPDAELMVDYSHATIVPAFRIALNQPTNPHSQS